MAKKDKLPMFERMIYEYIATYGRNPKYFLMNPETKKQMDKEQSKIIGAISIISITSIHGVGILCVIEFPKNRVEIV